MGFTKSPGKASPGYFSSTMCISNETRIKADRNKDGRVDDQEWAEVFRDLGKELNYERTAKYSSDPTEYLTNKDMKKYLGEK